MFVVSNDEIEWRPQSLLATWFDPHAGIRIIRGSGPLSPQRYRTSHVEGSAQCTAFAVSSKKRPGYDLRGSVVPYVETWIVTAGHCLQDGASILDYAFVTQKGQHGIHCLIGMSNGDQHDLAMLGFHTPRPVERHPILELALDYRPSVGERLLGIGYSEGVLRTQVAPFVGWEERGHMLIDGWIARGNSGGPVLIPGTRKAIGVMIETELVIPHGVSHPGIYCRSAACAPKPPYTAPHVNHVMGLARFSMMSKGGFEVPDSRYSSPHSLSAWCGYVDASPIARIRRRVPSPCFVWSHSSSR